MTVTDPPPRPIRQEPFNAEAPPEALDSELTPTGSYFVRSNFQAPELDPDRHRIRIEGAVAQPGAVSLADLRAMESQTVRVTTECAGNGRIGMAPLPEGEPWDSHAVSTAEWRGVPLRTLLASSGLEAGVVEVRCDGADRGTKPDAEGTIAFSRSLPLEVALESDVLVAYEMNGGAIPRDHGAPVRLIVPRWYGMASVKWLERIEARVEPFEGYFQRKRYVYDEGDGTAPEPVTTMRVRSLVTSPRMGEVLEAGPLDVCGWAWSGRGPVDRVDVALDGGDDWRAAALSPPSSPQAWQRWRFRTELREPGRHVIRSRARDATGAVQPDRPPWNRHGYGQNAVRPVVVEVR